MTLRWISLVPPAMVKHRVTRNPCAQRWACPSNAAPSGPNMTRPISWTRCSCSAPSSFRTLTPGPGSVPASVRRVDRWAKHPERLGLDQQRGEPEPGALGDR